MIFGADSRKFTPSKVSGYTVISCSAKLYKTASIFVKGLNVALRLDTLPIVMLMVTLLLIDRAYTSFGSWL